MDAGIEFDDDMSHALLAKDERGVQWDPAAEPYPVRVRQYDFWLASCRKQIAKSFSAKEMSTESVPQYAVEATDKYEESLASRGLRWVADGKPPEPILGGQQQ
ncbi:unnamed protein product [Sympodiomycopsis kandeliae]